MSDDTDVKTIVEEILSKFDIGEKSKEMLSSLTDRDIKVADFIRKRLSQGYSLVDGIGLVNELGEQLDFDIDEIKKIEARAMKKLQAETHQRELCCSFCGKKQTEVKRLIESQISKTLICDTCVKTSLSLLKE